MFNIAIVALPHCHASGVHGVMDFFTVANFCGRSPAGQSEPLFNCQVVTVDDQPVHGYSGALVTPTIKRGEFEADLVVVGSSVEAAVGAERLERTLAPSRALHGWLRAAQERGVVIASVCTGSFVLAEAGLLDDQIATTHWRAAPLFRSRYPHLRLEEDRLVVDNGQIICAGGASAFTDLCIYLVERFASPAVALACSKLLVLDGRRAEQTPYMAFYSRKAHQDGAIRKAQAWLEQHYAEALAIDDVAAAVGLGPRTFKRRFKEATGETPLGYLQHLRIEAAKHLLESSREQTARIIWSVGYEDASSFRRLFKRTVGCTMEQYRKRFSYVSPVERRSVTPVLELTP
ncbi:helix-turn-helix domain-containing protein [Marinobacter lipolyticus]|uniref:GlxA family transcriptional regulator n=1 Tax=Marinobacter lipolyticus TaxID=209639 RepID=UPI001BCC8D8C|nr:helix-turn-helix domain-containing protein [Marinobacter lipolyticus]MBS8239892.1 helix-turn-helix domain-containing protein [Marinobacter lipolyticus]